MQKQNKCLILLTKGVSEYRATIPKYINRNDIVLEVGFAWGTTTNLISKYAKKVVGIDKGESFYTAVRDYPKLELYKIDGFDISSVIDLDYQFNKIYIDISGCRSLFQVQKMILMYSHTFKPELIVVKSSKLKRFVQQCKIWKNHPDSN
jgi:hypothetical protein